MDINKSTPTKFELSFSKIPTENSISDDKSFKLHIIDTILPSISLTRHELPWQGGQIYKEGGGIEYGSWTTNFHIDEKWENYSILFDWIMSMYDGYSTLSNEEGQIDGQLVIKDHYMNEVVKFYFDSIWPIDLGDVTLSYQEGDQFLICPVTFSYNFFKKL